MMSEIGRSRLVSKRRSRLVRMPTSLPFLAAVLGDRHAGDPVLLHQVERFVDPVGRRQRDRVDDHAALRPLHPVDFGGLLLDRQVLVDDADAALLRHRDGQPRLGHRIHRRAQQRHVHADVAGDREDRRRPRSAAPSNAAAPAARRRTSAPWSGRWRSGRCSGRPFGFPFTPQKRKGQQPSLLPLNRSLADVARCTCTCTLHVSTPRGTSCTSFRCRTDTDRCGRPSARRA